MTIKALYKKLSGKDFITTLKGEIAFEDEAIRWYYDGLSNDTDYSMNNHLSSVVERDKELIFCLLEDLNIERDFKFTDPDYDETFTTFYITEI